MTVNTTNIVSGPYSGNDVADTFSYTFRITTKNQLTVYETDDNGVETVLAVDTDYTVAGVGNDAGGTLTRVAGALPSGYTWYIRSNYPQTQLTAFQSQGAFFPSLHEDAMDQLTFLIQQLRDGLGRAPRLSDSYSGSIPLSLQSPQAGRYLAWNNSLDGVINSLIPSTVLPEEYESTISSLKGSSDNYQAGTLVYVVDYYGDVRGGGGPGLVKTTAQASADGDVIDEWINHTLANGNVWVAQGVVDVKRAGAKHNTDSTTAVGFWLDYLIAGGFTGYAYDGTFLIDYITKSAASGLRLEGNATFKATGSNRLNMFRLTGVKSDVRVDGITFDGDNRVARPFEIRNTGGSVTSSPIGSVRLGPSFKVTNAKNNAPDTFTAAGVYVVGAFLKVNFAGTIDTVDSSSTSGAVSIGLWTGWTADTGATWIRHVVIESTALIQNVKNDNTVLADADGCQVTAPTTVTSFFTVEPGATFRDCKGRSIKSQVIGNQINSPVVYRQAYDGLVEINLQYAGGHVHGAQVHYDGTRVNSVIGVTQRTSPSRKDTSVTSNVVTIKGSPSSNTGALLATDVTDATVKAQGVSMRDNRVDGTVDAVVSARVANVVDVNYMVIDGNWARSVATAYLVTTLFGAARAQLTVTFVNNACENGCTGGSITNDLIVMKQENNFNISPLPNLAAGIVSGAVTIYSPDNRISTEGGAGFDDLDTINVTDSMKGQLIAVRAQNDTRTVTVKNGTGNIHLSGSDFVMDNLKDVLLLKHDADNNWLTEVSRSDNGA